MSTINVEYELDQWEWQGSTQSIELDSEDFDGMSDAEIRAAVYERICEDGQRKMHFVYPESEILSQIKEALAEEESE